MYSVRNIRTFVRQSKCLIKNHIMNQEKELGFFELRLFVIAWLNDKKSNTRVSFCNRANISPKTLDNILQTYERQNQPAYNSGTMKRCLDVLGLKAVILPK